MVNKPETKYVILPFIVLYINNRLWLEGHIYKTKRSLFLIEHKEHFWRNVRRVLHSYLQGSTKSIFLEIHFNGEIYKVKTSKHGQFDLCITCPDCKVPDLSELRVFFMKGKRRMSLEVPEPFNHCFFSLEDKNTAVISDIDDTVLVTHTRNTLRKFRTLLIKNAFRRKAVKEMREFYEIFADKGYPFLYVTNSESNLFPMIRLFLEHNRFPVGPVFLKSYVKWNQMLNRIKKTSRNGHKKEKIEFIFNSFPGMEFILIGDDSQKDPEIYAEIAEKYPERVKEIYIRNVKNNTGKKRSRIKNKIEKEYGIKFNFFMTASQIHKD